MTLPTAPDSPSRKNSEATTSPRPASSFLLAGVLAGMSGASHRHQNMDQHLQHQTHHQQKRELIMNSIEDVFAIIEQDDSGAAAGCDKGNIVTVRSPPQ
jgi:hypothetical protein